MIKDLIADKKRVGCGKNVKYSYGTTQCGTEKEFRIKKFGNSRMIYCQSCKAKLEALEKGISVATKLIEDEISFLKSFAENLILGYPIDKEGNCTKIDIRDRIKYLKSLLEQ